MIWCLLALAWAKPQPATVEQVSDNRKEPTRVYFTEPVQPLDGYKADDCDHSTYDWTIPVGVWADAHVVTPDCGEPYLFLDMPSSIGPNRTEWIRVLPGQVSLSPPKSSKWSGAAQSEAFVSTARGQKQRGIVIDGGPGDSYIFMPSEQVEVLDPELAVVRTVTGRVVQLANHRVDEQDRLVRDNQTERRAAVDRLLSTRASFEEDAPIRGIPPSEELLASPKAWSGHVFVMEMANKSLSHPAYAREWIEPVGHRHTTHCARVPNDDFEPCGAYFLDYTAFGAWVPPRETTVFVRMDGVEEIDGEEFPRLEVLVRGPFARTVYVSDTWAPRQD